MAAPAISNDERRRRIGIRHLLAPGIRRNRVGDVAEALVALHSSDPVTVYLSTAARANEVTVASIDEDLYRERSVFRHHAMRRTLWVMDPTVIVAGHASCNTRYIDREVNRFVGWLDATDDIVDGRRWLTEASDKAVELIESAGPMTTRDVGDALPELAIPVTVGAGTRQETTIAAHSRVLLLAGFAGRIVRGPPQGTWIASHYRWAGWSKWGLPDLDGVEPRLAAAELARKVLRTFGPATFDDLKWWTGWTVSMLRMALDDISAQIVELETGNQGWVNAEDVESTPEPGPWVALLPGLDPTPMGWKERDWYLTKDVAARVFDRNGNVGPTIWVDGTVAGGWAQRPDGEIVVELAEELGSTHRSLLSKETERLRAFLGETRISVRFPSPNQRDLLA